MKLTIIGCSDAFGAGGRLQTCFHVAHSGGELLIDCGATSLIGLQREGLDPNRISHIFVSHLHGDHFSGLVWWLLHANFVAKRQSSLTVVGPPGLGSRFETATEALFPGALKTVRRFDLIFVELSDRMLVETGGVKVTPYEVSHPSGAPPYALRFEIDGKILAFSGDTEWVETLVPAAENADLFICECSAFDSDARFHLNWRTVEANLPRFKARRLLLTHMGPEMLANRSRVTHPSVTLGEDGLKLDI